jgi:rhodanese-related sulfurtransferase
MKILFAPDTGRLLGAQAVGHDGVDKRIDVFATAIKGSMTVQDLAELELAYAPPFGSAKDPVNMAGMAAQNVLVGDVTLAQWNEVEPLTPSVSPSDGERVAEGRVRGKPLLLDVRRPDERAKGFIPGSIHIPLDEIRARLNELPRNQEIIVHCQSGQRSYFACRILSQHGFRVRNLTGSYRTWKTATTPHGS